MDWPKYLSFYNYAFEILLVNELSGLTFKIDDATVTVGGLTLTTDGLDVSLTGDFFIDFFGFNKEDKETDFVMLGIWVGAYLLLGYLALSFLHRSKR